ncbi:MAG: hypothetical protein QNM02_17095 [Acidimicrobiia bacterium]|nr:hypothetical protein [Acidimicrobiia bacterium]
MTIFVLPHPRRPMLELTSGRAHYDESFWRKRPDWTYATSEQDIDG